ncbi:MAG: hypothetical protein WA715_13810 [Candidatus Acidiferrum sp.]
MPPSLASMRLVEVEVNVGSAKMTDFNVVGLPDNAVTGEPRADQVGAAALLV